MQLDNLALACWACNLKKGPNLTGLDPETEEIISLFNPRKDRWADHFAFIVGSSPKLGIENSRPDAGWADHDVRAQDEQRVTKADKVRTMA
jgi:hypothetical protein